MRAFAKNAGPDERESDRRGSIPRASRAGLERRIPAIAKMRRASDTIEGFCAK